MPMPPANVVYRSDGSVLSEHLAHFATISNADNYLFTKDGRTVHVNGNPIADTDPRTFPPDRGTTRCSATSISFGQ